MYHENGCLGDDCTIQNIRVRNEELNAMVLDQVNGTQKLVMMNTFARESNDYLYKRCLHERITEITSWRWVLSDLTKRLEESIEALKYEHNALRVVIQRIGNEIDTHSRENSRPGAMTPVCDQVEDTILEELKFLREQKKKFERIIPDLDKQTAMLEKTKKKILADILDKERAISVDETDAMEHDNVTIKEWKKKRKKSLPINRWEKRCAALKRAGLRDLANAIITRHQVRGARVQLSVAAQSYAAKVDSALRRRLHANKINLQDLDWQRQEAVTDYKSLGEELTTIEQSILETMDQERIVESRLANRTLRPGKELIKDDVDRKLIDELNQIKLFSRELRSNMESIISLQNNLADAITKIDCFAEDLIQVIKLDEDRLRTRLEDNDTSGAPQTEPERQPTMFHDGLEVIKEEDEENEEEDLLVS